MISHLRTAVTRFFDASYVLKFLFRLFAMYLLFRLINWLMVGAVTPEGYYSAFLDRYLNYITLIKVSVLNVGSFFARLAGVDSFLIDSSIIQIVGSKKLLMAWACCGLEIMSFWAAFVLADTTPLLKKLRWCFLGLFCIWFINCIRVALLLLAIKNKWFQLSSVEHHDIFNIVAYGLVLILMVIYYQKNRQRFTEN